MTSRPRSVIRTEPLSPRAESQPRAGRFAALRFSLAVHAHRGHDDEEVNELLETLGRAGYEMRDVTTDEDFNLKFEGEAS